MSMEREVDLFSTLVSGSSDCWVCLEPVRFVADQEVDMQSMLPIGENRGSSCRHLIHHHCAESLMEHNRVIAEYWVDEDVFHQYVGVRCYCGLVVRHFENADDSLGEYFIIHFS